MAQRKQQKNNLSRGFCSDFNFHKKPSWLISFVPSASVFSDCDISGSFALADFTGMTTFFCLMNTVIYRFQSNWWCREIKLGTIISISCCVDFCWCSICPFDDSKLINTTLAYPSGTVPEINTAMAGKRFSRLQRVVLERTFLMLVFESVSGCCQCAIDIGTHRATT